MSRSRSRTSAELVALGALALATLAAAASARPFPWRAPYAEGERVRFEGIVSDPQGRPLPGVDVRLAASAPGFDWRSFSREVRESRTAPSRTDDRGRFEVEWAWDSGFREFELVVSVAVRRSGVEVDQELERLDLGERVRQGAPVTAAVSVRRADYVRGVQAFVAALVTDDQRRVHQQLGLPESVDDQATAAGLESAWWYFELGRVARFLDGRLLEVESFPPVPERSGEAP